MRPGQTILVKTNATNGELQRAIEAAIPQATKQAATFASRYKGKNEWETCKKIFDYLKNSINYKADGLDQQVRLPSGLMRTKQGDCKSYSVFTSAVLSNLGIPHKLVYASYDPKDSTPSHIYVMTDCGYIVDAVYGKFNAEKKATYKKYKPMNISYIAGVKPRKIGRSLSAAQKIAIGAQKVLPMAVGGRSIVRNLIQKNAGGFATSLNKLMVESRSQRPGQTSWDKMRSIELNWLNKGGNPNELYESIAEGASKTPTGAYFNKLMKMKAGGYSPNPAQWIAAAVSALFGKKYNEATGAISGEPASTTAVVVTTAPWWATTVAGIVTTLGVAYITQTASPAPGETPPITPGDNTGGGAAPRSSALLPILLIGGAAAAYFILKPGKK